MNVSDQKYSSADRHFVIRTQRTPVGHVIEGFENEQQVTFGYGVSYEIGFDFQQVRGENAVEALIGLVKSDLDRLAT